MRIRLMLAVAAVSAGVLGASPALIASEQINVLAGCGQGYYKNSDGQCIPDPSLTGGTSGGGAPPGATAICKDGDYSYSTHRSGTCSGHGGVKQWLTN